MKKILLGAIATVVISSTAFAADLPARTYSKAPVAVAPIYNWGGVYVGGHAGYGFSDPRYDFVTAGHYNFVPGDSFKYSTDGFIGGGHLGYNWVASNFLFGLEGAFSYSDIKGSAASPFFPVTDTFHTNVRWIATVTPRLGVTSGAWLFYAKGGVAFADINTEIRDTVHYNARSSTKTGWTVGGGVEYLISSNWVVGVEGNYYDFGRVNGGSSQSLLIATNLPAPFTLSDHSTRADLFSVLGRVSYKFGGPVVAKY